MCTCARGLYPVGFPVHDRCVCVCGGRKHVKANTHTHTHTRERVTRAKSVWLPPWSCLVSTPGDVMSAGTATTASAPNGKGIYGLGWKFRFRNIMEMPGKKWALRKRVHTGESVSVWNGRIYQCGTQPEYALVVTVVFK